MPRHAAPPLMMLILAALGVLAGCKQFPELDAASSDAAMQADWPRLQPLPPIIAAGEAGTLTEATTDQIQARGTALRQRAAALRASKTQ